MRICDFIARSVQDIEEKRLQQLGCVVPTVEVEGLESAECERVFDVVEEKSVLSGARPAMETIFQFPDDLSEIAQRPLFGFENVHSLDGAIQLALFFEIQLVSLAFDQYAKKRIEELQIVARRLKRERVDREVPRFVTNVQVRTAENAGQRLKAAADIEDVGERLVLLRVLQNEICEKTLARASGTQNERVGDIAVVQIQVIRSGMVGFKHGEVLRA